MSNKPILFFSSSCNHCIKLWKELKRINILDSIVKINVANNRNIPKSITSVPTLVVRGRPPITGDAIFLFLNSFSPSSSKSNSQTNNQSREIKSNNIGISDFLPGEMGSSWSDQYSFIDNPTNPINHSYSFLNNTNSGIPNQNEIKNISRPKSNSRSSDLGNRLEAFKNARSKDYNR